MEIKFTASAQLNDFIRKCDNLDFECLKIGTDGTLIEKINADEVTPYATGNTQEHNEIIQEGRYKCLANTNTEYGGRIHDNGPDHGRFHNAWNPPYQNAAAEQGWLLDKGERYSSFVIEEIKKEIGSKK